jgi:hypothetical protein
VYPYVLVVKVLCMRLILVPKGGNSWPHIMCKIVALGETETFVRHVFNFLIIKCLPYRRPSVLLVFGLLTHMLDQ